MRRTDRDSRTTTCRCEPGYRSTARCGPMQVVEAGGRRRCPGAVFASGKAAIERSRRPFLVVRNFTGGSHGRQANSVSDAEANDGSSHAGGCTWVATVIMGVSQPFAQLRDTGTHTTLADARTFQIRSETPIQAGWLRS